MTKTTSWKSGSDGDFNMASNWTNGVPNAGDTALITVGGTYTVTSAQDNSVGTLEMAKKATLDVSSFSFAATVGTGSGVLAGTVAAEPNTTFALGAPAATTTFDNTGAIDLQSSSGNSTKLAIAGNVTLGGKGKIDLSGNDSEIVASAGTAATLTSSNTISGFGVIGDQFDALLGFVNAAKGVVDADTSLGILVDTDGGGVTNSGLMEASGDLSVLYLVGSVVQIGAGKVEAVKDGQVILQNGVISGGTVSIAKGSLLAANIGSNSIGGDVTVTNAGKIEAVNAATVQIDGPVKNAGELAVAGGTLLLLSKVTGGEVEFKAGAGTEKIEFASASSAKVTFDPNAIGTLVLDDPAQFTGTVAGMSGAPGASIDLENIAFADFPKLVFDAAKHLLTVTDPVTGTTDKIKIVGSGSFTDGKAADGSTLISDPPADPAGVTDAKTRLLAQSMAAFGAGTAAARYEGGEGNFTPSDTLAANPHWHG